MRASAAALHAFGQTVAGLGLGSVLLGYLSDSFAARAFTGDYAATCLAASGTPSSTCLAASATGLQQAMLAVGGFLLIAIYNYLSAARVLPGEIREAGQATAEFAPAH